MLQSELQGQAPFLQGRDARFQGRSDHPKIECGGLTLTHRRLPAITSDDDGTVLGLKTVLRPHQHRNTDLREANSCPDSIRSSTFVDDYLIYEKIF
jgi:hypothetical protein